ncbi:hypothetical protein OB2597_02302 [Pseudooceanicola batsensis HTCC2597]|uniref:Uncharacterized protein n=1 Tax=Pseudooceanicola batsensis (strain ATCC BAA-863 / DSM 15984 / KCTC 12145 / HTCC2597) TaxID=252305 RepID=A3TX54_PSEBH|nr:hypothetical protein [Pseudooceanicola batsensis]EAQ03414.1 hypothetical protein OB2597_02302 [Pseudooceanicola batsensis HTCC2597]
MSRKDTDSTDPAAATQGVRQLKSGRWDKRLEEARRQREKVLAARKDKAETLPVRPLIAGETAPAASADPAPRPERGGPGATGQGVPGASSAGREDTLPGQFMAQAMSNLRSGGPDPDPDPDPGPDPGPEADAGFHRMEETTGPAVPARAILPELAPADPPLATPQELFASIGADDARSASRSRRRRPALILAGVVLAGLCAAGYVIWEVAGEADTGPRLSAVAPALLSDAPALTAPAPTSGPPAVPVVAAPPVRTDPDGAFGSPPPHDVPPSMPGLGPRLTTAMLSPGTLRLIAPPAGALDGSALRGASLVPGRPGAGQLSRLAEPARRFDAPRDLGPVSRVPRVQGLAPDQPGRGLRVASLRPFGLPGVAGLVRRPGSPTAPALSAPQTPPAVQARAAPAYSLVVIGADPASRLAGLLSGMPIRDIARRDTRFAPDVTQVHYFHDADTAAARDVADRLGGKAVDLRGMVPAPEAGSLEVHLAAD